MDFDVSALPCQELCDDHDVLRVWCRRMRKSHSKEDEQKAQQEIIAKYVVAWTGSRNVRFQEILSNHDMEQLLGRVNDFCENNNLEALPSWNSSMTKTIGFWFYFNLQVRYRPFSRRDLQRKGCKQPCSKAS